MQKIVRNFFFLYKLRGFFCGEGSTFWQCGRLCGRSGLRSRPRRTPTEHLPKTNRKKNPKHIKEKFLHNFCNSFSTTATIFCQFFADFLPIFCQFFANFLRFFKHRPPHSGRAGAWTYGLCSDIGQSVRYRTDRVSSK